MPIEQLHVVRHHPDAGGPPVVLVHGAPDRSKNFAHVLHRLGHVPVTVYDRRGYGRSVHVAGAEGGFDIHARDLIELLEGRPSVVVGQSAGGAIAMLAATRRPELFLGLGAWEPPMVPWAWWAGPQALERLLASVADDDDRRVGEAFNRQILGDERWEELRENTRELLRSEGTAFRADMMSQCQPYFDLADLAVPFLVGCGTVCDDMHRGAPQRLAEHSGAGLFVGEGTDHYAHLSCPEVWAEFVLRTVALATRAERDGPC